jgi:hypothetical protein
MAELWGVVHGRASDVRAGVGGSVRSVVAVAVHASRVLPALLEGVQLQA